MVQERLIRQPNHDRRISVPVIAEAGLAVTTAASAVLLGKAIHDGSSTEKLVYSTLTAVSAAATLAVDRMRRRTQEQNGVSPRLENLGESCMWWRKQSGCIFPKIEMEGKRDCKGKVSETACPLVRRQLFNPAQN